MTWEEENVRRVPPQVQGRRLAEACRHCGIHPVWVGDLFCGLCKLSLHTQVAAYLSDF
jgi:hypothetical protein